MTSAFAIILYFCALSFGEYFICDAYVVAQNETDLRQAAIDGKLN